jgi:hypothetical protein
MLGDTFFFVFFAYFQRFLRYPDDVLESVTRPSGVWSAAVSSAGPG